MKNILTYLIMLCLLNGYSQGTELYDLQLDFSGMKKYRMNFKKSAENTLMIVSKQTSTKKFSKNDSLQLMKLLKVNTKESKEKLHKIIEEHRIFKIDTLFLENENPIVATVDNFVINWSKLKKDLEINPDQRIILDGYMVKLSLDKNNRIDEEIYAQSPTKKSHPEISGLISELENYYKKKSKNSVFD